MGRPTNYNLTLSHAAKEVARASDQNTHLLNADVAYSRGVLLPCPGGLASDDTWGVFSLLHTQHNYKCWHAPIWWEGTEAYLYPYMVCTEYDIPSSSDYDIILTCTIMNLSNGEDESGEYVSQSWTITKDDLAESRVVNDPAQPSEYAQMRPLKAGGAVMRMAITSGPMPSMGKDPGHPLYVVTEINGDAPASGQYVILTLPAVYIVPAYPQSRS